MIRAGQFREDLYYRLQVIEIRVPPLRDRRDEIPTLVDFFLRRYADATGGRRSAVAGAAADARRYPWPGNIRELENMMKRFVILQDESLLLAELARERPIGQRRRRAGAAPPAPPWRRRSPHGRRSRRRQWRATAPAPPAAAAPKPGKLPDLARAAALSAEREAIQSALDHFRWNRRKAAAQLGVSYKTLLNKMKECGITAPGRDADEAE